MPVEIRAEPFCEPLKVRIARPLGDIAALYWLGQAGFLVRTQRWTILIDPYLSDSLEKKYRGSAFSHERMMAAPITVDEIGPVDLVLCTHHHTDHMDPETLTPLGRRSSTRFVVPAASREEAIKRTGVREDRLVCADAGQTLEPLPGLFVKPVRAAHETLVRNDAGQYVFLGYGIEIPGLRLFHSGDAVPFQDQIAEVKALGSDVALLPVNGRSKERERGGVPGNFFLCEATALARACGIPFMLAHHYGMFAFNTIDRGEIERESARPAAGFAMRPATLGVEYVIRVKATTG